jgi:hypothetical protein
MSFRRHRPATANISADIIPIIKDGNKLSFTNLQ